MRVLLVTLNTYESPFAAFPIGLAYIHDALVRAAHDVAIFDCLLSPEEAYVELLAEFKPEVIGFSLRNIDNVRADKPETYLKGLPHMLAITRAQSKAHVVIGGAGFSIFPKEIMELTQADFGLQGEAEVSFPELLRQLEHNCLDADSIAGLFYRDATSLCRESSAPRHLIPSTPPMNPPPWWVKEYIKRGAIFNTQTQRGCPLHCCYCTYPLIEGSRTRSRNPTDVVEEIRNLSALGVKYVFLVDSVFNTSRRHWTALTDALIEADTGMKWGCFLRPQDWTVADFTHMEAAGLRHIEFGSDSFSDKVLQSYGKSFRLSQIVNSSKAAEQAGIHFCHFLILGGWGETEETIQETFTNSKLWQGGFFFAFPGMRVYPFTPLWREMNVMTPNPLPDNLLKPFFYVAPGMNPSELNKRLETELKEDPRWLSTTLPPEFYKLVPKLRSRGIQGPLWEYFDVLQRMQNIQIDK